MKLPSIKPFLNSLQTAGQKIRRFFGAALSKISRPVSRFPFIAFLFLIALLVGLVAVGNNLRKPPVQAAAPAAKPKLVDVFHIGKQPYIKVQGHVEKSGVITVNAMTSGIVQKLNVQEGKQVKRGAQLLSLSTNYTGGTTATVNRQMSQRRYQFQLDTYDEEKQRIAQEKEYAQKTDIQATDLRAIGRQSLSEAQSLIDLNQDIISTLDKNIKTLQDTNVGGANDASILQAKQLKAQVLSQLNQGRSLQRTNEYNFSDSNPPAQLADLLRDKTLKALDFQEKMLDLNRDVAAFTVKMDRINESLYFPAATSTGVVERVFVKVGQAVNPGTPLAIIRANNNQATVVVLVSQQIARMLAQNETAILHIDNRTVKVVPSYVSGEPTEGTLHSIMISVPDGFDNELSNNTTISVELPIGFDQHIINDPYIPLDAVYQTQDSAYLYVVGTNEQGSPSAQLRTVKIGAVFGQYLQVFEGVKDSDVVIMDRNVQTGDWIQIK
jgi:multidrug efflux pump subunit AcrA (membrane-fusion protein)